MKIIRHADYVGLLLFCTISATQDRPNILVILPVLGIILITYASV
jgi:hypothetical protein